MNYVRLKHGATEQTQADAQVHVNELKCGFTLASEIRKNFDRFSPERQKLLKQMDTRPDKETSVVTPNGYFRVHYNTTGSDAPGYDLNELLAALDSVYNFEINILGYEIPPSDNMQGGDNLYDVYINNYNRGTYGETVFETDLPGDRKITYMCIDNDFEGYYTTGINAARVTIAHEFFHAIQVGDYIFRGSDTYYYEASSVAMEEFVFDDVNDYYGELSNYFNRPSKTISSFNGYNLGIINLFLQQRYDFAIIKRIWELMVEEDFLFAFEDAVAERGSSFQNEFNQFGIWTFFTGKRAIPGYFEEADFYPLIRPVNTVDYSAPYMEVMVNSAPVTNNFIQFNTSTDTIMVLVTNSDVENGVNSETTLTQFDYGIYNSYISGSQSITENYYGLLTTEQPALFKESLFYNDELIGAPVQENINEPYPLPFRYSMHDLIKIPTGGKKDEEVYLNVYSTSLDLVYDGFQVLTGSSGGIVTWNGRKSNGDKLSSGVYVFVVKHGDTLEKGKLVIFND